MTHRPGFSLHFIWLFTEQPPERRPAAAAAAGFQAVEIPQPDELEPDAWHHILEDAAVRHVLMNTPAGPSGTPTGFGSACVPGAEEEFRAEVRLALHCATEVNCSPINAMAGVLPPTVDPMVVTDSYPGNFARASAEGSGTDVTRAIAVSDPQIAGRPAQQRAPMDQLRRSGPVGQSSGCRGGARGGVTVCSTGR